MDFLRKTFLTNETTSMDVELGNFDSGSGAASSSSHQPSISMTKHCHTGNAKREISSRVVTAEHPLNTFPSPAPLINQSQGPIPDQFTTHTPQNTLPNRSGLASDTTSFRFSIPQTTLSPLSRLYSASPRKRTRENEEHADRVRVIQLEPKTPRIPRIESTKAIL
jgi:hypothetical protein